MIEYILGIPLLIVALALVVVTLIQQGKDKSLSGSIAGGADSFFGSSKASKGEKTLQLVTTILAVVFMLVVIVMYIVVS